MATEIGHIPYKKAPFLCGCGRNNCLELYASGSGIAKWMEHKKLLCAASLHELERTGEKEIVEMFHEALFSALGTTLTLFNPQVLVLGGGIIDANPYLENLILENIKNSLHLMPVVIRPIISSLCEEINKKASQFTHAK